MEHSDSAELVHADSKKTKPKAEVYYEGLIGLGWTHEQIAPMSDSKKRVIFQKGEKPPQNGHESAAAAASEPPPVATEAPPQVERSAELSEEEKRRVLRAPRSEGGLGYPKEVESELTPQEVDDIHRNQQFYRAAPRATPAASPRIVTTTLIDRVRKRNSGNGAVIFVVLVIILLLLAFWLGWVPRFWEQAATPTPSPVATASLAPTATIAATASPTPVAVVKQNFLVQDANGNPVEGVSVWAVAGQDRSPTTGDVRSNSRGEVTLDLKAGQSYRVSASKDGFDLYNSSSLVTAGSAPLTISVKMAPTGTASEGGRPGTDTSGFVAPNAATRDQAIEGAMFYGSRNGGIDSPSQVRSVTLTTIPVSFWRTAFRDGNLIGFRSGSDSGDSAWLIVTTDGRVFYIQVKCSNLVIPPQVIVTPKPTPTPVVTPRTPTPSSPPCCVVVPTPTPAPTPTPLPTKKPGDNPTAPPPPPPSVTPPPTQTPLPPVGVVTVTRSESCGTGCWRIDWTSPNTWGGHVVYGRTGYLRDNRVDGTLIGVDTYTVTLAHLDSTYGTFQAVAYPRDGSAWRRTDPISFTAR